MSDKYGYIGLETLLNFCSNDKNHCVTPNDFMRMNRVKIDDRPHGEWIPLKNKKGETVAWRCSSCGQSPKYAVNSDFCPNCGADMRGDDE